MGKYRFSLTPLAKRLVVLILAVSSTLALMFTAIQVTSEYQADIDAIDLELKRVQDAYVVTMSRAVYRLDTEMIQDSLESMSSLSDINYVEVYGEGFGLMGSYGAKKQSSQSYSFPLKVKSRGKMIQVGSMAVDLSYDQAVSNLFQRLAFILCFNLFKTSVVSLFILFIVYRLYTRHIQSLSSYMSDLSSSNLDFSLDLDKKRNSSKPDELDLLVDSLETMRIRLLDSYTQLSKELEHNKQMKSEMLGVAHQLGVAAMATETFHNVNNVLTPLQYPLLQVRKLMKDFQKLSEDEVTTILQEVSTRMERCLKLATNLIRVQQGHASQKMIFSSLDLNEICSGTVDMLRLLIRENEVVVKIDIDPQIKVWTVQFQLYHVVINVLKNAVEALSDYDQESKTIEISAVINVDFIDLKVKDNGPGIDAVKIDQLFTRGHTTKELGHGFGLHSCRQIMDSVGGDIFAESQGLGHGCTFTIQLPKCKTVTVA